MVKSGINPIAVGGVVYPARQNKNSHHGFIGDSEENMAGGCGSD
jgi:hypothetical protein